MSAPSNEEIESFVTYFRSELRSFVKSLKRQEPADLVDDLFAPPVVTTALFLGAMDYCMEHKLRPDMFGQVLRRFADQLEGKQDGGRADERVERATGTGGDTASRAGTDDRVDAQGRD